MKRGLVMVALLGMTGCASLNHAGTASYSMKPVLVNDKLVCCEVTINNGKEFALLDATVIKRGDDYEVRLHEEGVAAFDGQHLASDTAAKAATLGAAVLIAPVAAPAIGAMLAAPGLGTAAAGVGAGVLINKADTP